MRGRTSRSALPKWATFGQSSAAGRCRRQAAGHDRRVIGRHAARPPPAAAAGRSVICRAEYVLRHRAVVRPTDRRPPRGKTSRRRPGGPAFVRRRIGAAPATVSLFRTSETAAAETPPLNEDRRRRPLTSLEQRCDPALTVLHAVFHYKQPLQTQSKALIRARRHVFSNDGTRLVLCGASGETSPAPCPDGALACGAWW